MNIDHESITILVDTTYNKAIDDVLEIINNSPKVLEGTLPSGIPVLYKQTLINVIKTLKQKQL
jgi:2-phospho-L-lactate guanylyltransferase (CobY/MobA/RfbA family)